MKNSCPNSCHSIENPGWINSFRNSKKIRPKNSFLGHFTKQERGSSNKVHQPTSGSYWFKTIKNTHSSLSTGSDDGINKSLVVQHSFLSTASRLLFLFLLGDFGGLTLDFTSTSEGTVDFTLLDESSSEMTFKVSCCESWLFHRLHLPFWMFFERSNVRLTISSLFPQNF